MELQHFSDDHPLIFSAVTASGFTCDGCGESIKGSRYSCRKCDFDLHPSCAELPRELQHPIHSKHPLILHKTPPYDGKTCTCSVCNLPCKWFVYNCTHCKFNLDIKCASLRFIPGAETHDHQLTHFREFISFTCDFCGKEGMGMPYLCGICGFWVHRTCASLPRMLKHIRHKHPLNLTYSLKDNYSKHRLCQFCVKKVDTNYGVYYCSSCDYVAHLDCATDENGIDENFMQESKGEEPTEYSYIVKKPKVGEDKITAPI